MNPTNTANLLRVKELLSQNIVYYYAFKVARIIIEIGCYLFAFFLFIGGMAIPIDPLKFQHKLDESVTINGAIHIEELSGLMILLKALFIVFSLALLMIGLLFGSIRRKNNRIRKAAELVDGIINNNI